MNKKQLIIAWGMILATAWFAFNNLYFYVDPSKTWRVDIQNHLFYPKHRTAIDINKFLIQEISLIIVGGLLIYTLKDKKK